MLVPRATARLQLRKEFTLHHAAAVTGYYAALGISHLYLSPVFASRPGSGHGYDVIDSTRINPELGGEAGMLLLVESARANGMGLILDIVPNHMAAISPDNAWWADVLRHGRASAHASFFDIDWNREGLQGKVLLPVLGHPYGEALAAGEMRLVYDAQNGAFWVECAGTRLPLSPESLASLGYADPASPDDQAHGSTGAGSVAATLSRHDPGDRQGRKALHTLLEAQHYRLAWWRAAADVLNWRRFFEISELVGVRAEDPQVFSATHALVFRMFRDGWIDGVRVDHVDGLADPGGYCRALRKRLDELAPERPDGSLLHRPYLIVEKILGDDEPLRPDWLVDGTTGYEFMSDMAAVLHDPDGEPDLTEAWEKVAPGSEALDAALRAARRKMLYENLSSEFETLCRLYKQLADTDLATRDITLSMIRRALAALLERFRVYRTYFLNGKGSALDAELLQRALAEARHSLRGEDHVALEWVASVITEPAPDDRSGPGPVIAVRFQQLTSPLAAKSLEDTLFYRYGRLLSRNEVGSDPARFALSADDFHCRMQSWASRFPYRMLATATHDHKRGEDARARLAVLSEAPDQWALLAQRWLEAPDPTGGETPDRIDRYMLLQTLVGAWPLGIAPGQGNAAGNDDAGPRNIDARAPDDILERAAAWQTKALREAKRHTNWTAVNHGYEDACRSFLEARLADTRFLADLDRFAALISPAGAVNSLAQLAVRLTAPGVPDLYQGTEQWDFSMVDPDNRRPVDYAALRESLERSADWAGLLLCWRDGRIKQHLLRSLLLYRTSRERLFGEGGYEPLALSGPHAGRVLGFMRRTKDEQAMTVVSRLVFPLLNDARAGQGDLPLVRPELWGSTGIVPPHGQTGEWVNVITGERVCGDESGFLPLSRVLARLPVAVLEPADADVARAR